MGYRLKKKLDKVTKIPYYPFEDDRGHNYPIYSREEKMISDYTRLTFKEIEELSISSYQFLYKDAFIYRLQQTEKGMEYLQNAWILEQDKPDREELRKHFK